MVPARRGEGRAGAMSSTDTDCGGRSAVVGGCISCVIDNHPRLHLEALRWYACLTEVAGVDPSDLVVQVVGPMDSEPLRHLERQGVTVRPIDRFDERSPHCNKIAGALRLAEDARSGVVVLSDADTAILDDPRKIDRPDRAVSAKTVDSPIPPMDVFVRIFETAGIPIPSEVPLPWGPDQRTVRGNCNGGIYLLDGALLPQVASAWATWARWLLDRRELLEEWAIYVDQVAMAVALAAEGVEWHSLDVTWNTPTHDQTRIPPAPQRPHVLHYHQQVDPSGLITPVGRLSIDSAIEVANSAITQVFEEVSPSATLRRWRAADQPAGLPAEPSGALASLVAALRPSRVLEVTEADRSVVGGIHGTDPPFKAVLVTPSELLSGGVTDQSRESGSDLTVALDVLEHVESAADYRRMVEFLWGSTNGALVVSGFADCFGERGAGDYYHEPLRDTLRAVASDAEVYPVATGGSSETVALLRVLDDAHPRDFGSNTLAPLIDRIPDPTALLTMRLSARTTTGFYPDHSPRLWEYPVVARLIAENLEPGSRLVDVGAGVSPLAPFLSSKGYLVETVDPSPVRRDWTDHSEWSEWHFLDYAAADLASRSWNCTLDRVPVRPLFDGAYSVSVIEHVPAVARRALLADISARTRIGGLVVLTIDLQPGSDDLWNYNLAVLVDDPADHGTLQSVVEECSAVGLELIHEERVRDWPVTHVEIGLLAFRQRAPVTVARWRAARDKLRHRASHRDASPRG
jgi:Methyltransferase domain